MLITVERGEERNKKVREGGDKEGEEKGKREGERGIGNLKNLS